jgi:hypothetical protein
MSEALTEGTLYIQSSDHAAEVSFVPIVPGSHGSTGSHTCESDDELIAFLQELGIPQGRIDGALPELRLRGNVSLYPVHLPPEQITRYGL